MTEIARRKETQVPVNVSRPIQSLDEAYRLAANLAQAGLMPRDLRGKPPDVLAILLYGQDLGLSPMQSVQGIYVVEGRPSLSAQLWLALVRRAGHRAGIPCADCGRLPDEHKRAALDHFYRPDSDDQHCTFKVVRGDTGEEHTATFTVDDALAANLLHRDKDGGLIARAKETGKPKPWELHRKSMLQARAVSACCRFIAPEIALGFYSPDEVEEIAEREQVPSVRVEQPEPEQPAEPEQVKAEVADIEKEFAEEPDDPEAPLPPCASCGQPVEAHGEDTDHDYVAGMDRLL